MRFRQASRALAAALTDEFGDGLTSYPSWGRAGRHIRWGRAMKFLVLAYGAEADWLELTEERRGELLAQDDVLRGRGDMVAALGPATTVRTWDAAAPVRDGAFMTSPVPLAGFGVIEARDLDEAVALVARTPCAVAKGAVEVRPLLP